jgi:hypothetical protein
MQLKNQFKSKKEVSEYSLESQLNLEFFLSVPNSSRKIEFFHKKLEN